MNPSAKASPRTRREQIVDIVLDLVEEGGADAVSTTTIAARIGVTQPAVFRHFRTKEHLWLATLDRLDEQLRQMRAAALGQGDQGPLAVLGRIFTSHLELIAQRPAVAKLVFSDSLRTQFTSVGERFVQLHESYQADVQRLVAEARTSGLVAASTRTQDAVTLYFALIQGLAFQTTIAMTRTISPADRRRLYGLFLRALG